jgi:polar amino acid transport system substrate-binding protein
MHSTTLRFAALAVFFLGILCGDPSDSRADEITLAADEWCPYNCAPDSKEPGWMVELATAILTKAGHKVTYKIVPWTRAIAEARRGTFNGIIGAAKTDAPDFVFPDVPFGESRFSLYAKAGTDWQYTGVESLAGQVLGAIRDYSYGDPIDEYLKKHQSDDDKVQLVSGETALMSNVNKLLKGRVTTVVEDPAVMAHFLKETGLVGSLREAGQGVPQGIYVAFSPSNPKSKEYADLLTKGIREMKTSGEYDKIRSRYGVEK